MAKEMEYEEASRDGARDVDVVVLGASGFTGRKVLEYLIHLKDAKNLRVGAAGRSKRRVEAVLKAEEATERVKVFVVDVTKHDQLLAMAKQARVVLNCVGPYRYSGEDVVKACITAGSDYLDVSGEPEFMERVEMYHSQGARESGSFVASACGFDSVPGDLGTIFTQRQFSAPATPSSVEAFISFHTAAQSFSFNYATWESAVMGFSAAANLRQLRRSARKQEAGALKPAGPKLQPPPGISYDARVGTNIVPFPGSDASVVRRTQRLLAAHGDPPVHFAASFCVSSRWALLLLTIFGSLFRLLTVWALGRWLLLTFPGLFSWGIFSRQGPSQEQLEKTSFSILLIGKGYSSDDVSRQQAPDREIRVKVTGPDPGYVATPIMLVHAALTLLEERRKIEEALGKGGVFTPAGLLGGTSYVDRLQNAGISFKVLEDKPLENGH
jgi:short subunit dehydrogenase-like uncharacterized protein